MFSNLGRLRHIVCKREKQKPGCREKVYLFVARALLNSKLAMNRKTKMLLGLFAVLTLLACSSSARAYEEITVTNGATIRGTVKVEGTIPKLPNLQVSKYKEVCKDIPNESLMVGPNHGLRYAVITLEGITKGRAVEKEVVHELDNAKCRFVPHVQSASVGQFVLLKNTDPILHTAHAYFTNGQPQFNVGLYPGRVSRKPLITPGVVKILCEVHPWMTAYIVVTDHPYSSVTDAYGEYLMSEVPAGVYRLKVWHESLGTEEKQLEVKAGGSHNVDFVFNPKPGVKK